MKRLALLMTLSGLAGAALAQEPGFCTSICSSEKTQCLASATKTASNEHILPSDTPEKNPLARVAQVQMRSDDNGALERSGLQHRRMARDGACDDAYGRCTRSCKVEGTDDAVGKVITRHGKKDD